MTSFPDNLEDRPLCPFLTSSRPNPVPCATSKCALWRHDYTRYPISYDGGPVELYGWDPQNKEAHPNIPDRDKYVQVGDTHRYGGCGLIRRDA